MSNRQRWPARVMGVSTNFDAYPPDGRVITMYVEVTQPTGYSHVMLRTCYARMTTAEARAVRDMLDNHLRRNEDRFTKALTEGRPTTT